MRTSILTFLIVGLAAGQALATGPGRGGRGPRSDYAYVTISNACDDAVIVYAGSQGPRTLETNSSTTFVFYLSGGNTDVTISALLASDDTVSASESCPVRPDKTTLATVTCATTADGVSLMIECDRPRQVSVDMRRDAAVALASGSGLGFLLLLSTLLGRTPRHLRRKPVVEEASVPDAATA